MLRTALLGLTLTAVVGLAACAHGQADDSIDVSALQSPALIGCAGYTPPNRYANPQSRAMVEMKVLPDGSVDPSSVRLDPSRYHSAGVNDLERFLDLAKGCTFEPARVEKEPVESWTTMLFAFSTRSRP